MPCTCVVGLQWGDEAKGKIVDLLTDDHAFVVRYNGGANAGHTVVSGNQTFKLSLLPTGVLRPHVRAVIANGVVVYPPRFIEETANLRQAGVAIGDNLVVSDHAHVIFPYHLEEERLNEGTTGKGIGTTGRGIGPCYQDKVGRQFAVRLGELLYPDHLRERLGPIVERKNRVLRASARTPASSMLSRSVGIISSAWSRFAPMSSIRLICCMKRCARARAFSSRPRRAVCSTWITAPIPT